MTTPRIKSDSLPPCHFCHHPPTKNYTFVFCSNPNCRLSYAAGHGNRSQGTRSPALFSLKEWLQLLPKKSNPKFFHKP